MGKKLPVRRPSGLHGEPTNADRAEWARAPLELFASIVRSEEEDLATNAQDLISDLIHLARREAGADPETLLRMALANHDAEVEEDQEQ